MAQYDGSIRINTKIDTKNASAQMMLLENRIVKTADKVASLRSKMDALKDAKIPTQEYKDIQKQIEDTEKKLAQLAERQEKYLATGGKETSSVYKKMNYDVEQLNSTLEHAKGELQDLVDTGKAFTLGSDTQEYTNLGQQLQYAENDLSVLNQRRDELIAKNTETESSYVSLGESVKNAFRTMGKGLIDIPIATVKKGIEGLKTAFNGLGSFAKKSVSNIASTLKKTAKSMLSLGKSTKSTNGFFNGGLKSILKYGLGIRSLYALVNKLRSAIKEGFTNLYNDANMTAFKNQVDSLKASLTTLKNAFAAAFKPLVEIAIPYIQKAIEYITKLADAFGQLVSAITGQKTYTKAIKQTTAALKEEKKAAEGYLSPLDEINKYQTSKDSGADTGAGGTMFEDVPITDKFKDMAQWLKDMWDNADFTELGTLIGEKLKNALDNIPWDKIQETARKIGSSIATLINGFVEVDGLGYSIGNTLAQAVNTGFNFLNEFVHKLHWDSIGHFLADSLNGIFQNIDWDLIYDTFVTGAKGLGDAINSFVDDLDWDSIATSISNLVNTFVDTIYTFITTVDWKKLGEKVGKTISDAWKGIDWAKAGETLGEAFKAFFNFIAKTIENIDWKAVGESVKEFLIGIDWAGVAEAFFEAIGAIFGGLAAFLIGLIGDAWNSVVQWWHDVAYEDGEFTINGLLEGIKNALANIGEWIVEHIFQPFIDGFKAAFGIHSPSTVMQEMGVYIMQGLLGGITSLVGDIKETWESMKETAVEIWNKASDSFNKTMDDLKSKASSKLNDIGSSWKNAWDGMRSTVSSIISSVKSAISEFFNWISSKVDDIKESLSSIGKSSSLKSTAGSRFLSSSFSSSNKYLRSASYASPALASVPDVPIPKLATGAVIPANREFLAVLGDQKHGTNIEAPLDVIKQAQIESILEAFSQLGLTGDNRSERGNTYRVTAQANRRALFDIIIEEGKLRQMSTGKDPFVLT